MSAGGDHFVKNETIIPYGLGFEAEYNISKHLSIDIGTEFRTTGNRISDSFIISEFGGYSGPIHTENRDTYLDIPLHISYKIVNAKCFGVLLSGGYKATLEHLNYYSKTNVESRFKITKLSSGLEFGLVEKIMLIQKFGVFFSQYYDYYLTGVLDHLEAFDLKAGICFNIK